MKIITRYIATSVILSTCTVVLTLIGIESFIEFINQLTDIGKQDYTLLVAFQYVLMQLPSIVYKMFPMAAFLGALLGLGRLASSSELIVIRAFGYSKFAIFRSVIIAALGMLLVITFTGEVIAPKLVTHANTLKAIALHQQTGLKASTNYWLRHNNRIIYINTVVSANNIRNISYFDFNNARELIDLGHANYGRLKGKKWQLFNIDQSTLTAHHVRVKHIKEAALGTNFDPFASHQTKKTSTGESLKNLFHNILYLKSSGIISNRLEFLLWQRITQPFTTIVLICLAIPFIFGSLRDASTGARTMAGILVGFSFYMLNQFFGPITMVYQFPPLLAAIAPTLLFSIIYYILISRIT